MASVKLGKNASIKKGSTTIALMTNFSVSINSTFVDATSFLDDFEQPIEVNKNWNATVSGYFDPTDTGQASIESLAVSGGSIDDLRFYIDATNYFACDTARDPDAAVYIESFNPTADKAGIVAFTANIKGVGPVKRFDA
jgi:hypothetical protein